MVLDEVFPFWKFQTGDAWSELTFPITDYHRGRPREEALLYCSPDNYYPKAI